MKTLEVFGSAEKAVVDDCDFDEMSRYSWSLTGDGYAKTNVKKDGGYTTRLLHTMVADRAGLAGEIDHRDRVKLNCRRKNLRPCTRSQNRANIGPHRSNKLGVRGVYFSCGKFKAYIRKDGKRTYLGGFDTLEEAAETYRKAASDLFGEFAYHRSSDADLP